MPETYYTWETDEYTHNEVNPDWIWALGIIALIILVLSILYKNYLFGVLITLGTICIIYLKLRTPKQVTIEITDRCISIGEDDMYYQDIKYFWIDVTKGKNRLPHLLLARTRALSPLVVIAIPEDVPIKDLRANLITHTTERQMKESEIYEIMEKLGF